MPWCFGGDFNAVRLPSERSGLGPFSSAKVYDFFFLIWVSKLQSSDVTCRIASFECMPANFFVCVHEK